MSKKLPAFMLYTGDWLKDPQLSICSPATRGIWIDLICSMWENDRCGKVSGTLEQLSRLARCSVIEIKKSVKEMEQNKAAKITYCNGVYRICNRRMHRDYKERINARDRVNKYRAKRKGVTAKETQVKRKSNKKVTTLSSYSVSNKEKKDKKKKVLKDRINDFILKVKANSSKYDDVMICSFIDYWTEHNDSGSKMRFEMQQTFDINRRLSRWHSNQKDWRPVNGSDNAATGVINLILKTIDTIGSYSMPEFGSSNTDIKAADAVRVIGWGTLCRMTSYDARLAITNYIDGNN